MCNFLVFHTLIHQEHQSQLLSLEQHHHPIHSQLLVEATKQRNNDYYHGLLCRRSRHGVNTLGLLWDGMIHLSYDLRITLLKLGYVLAATPFRFIIEGRYE